MRERGYKRSAVQKVRHHEQAGYRDLGKKGIRNGRALQDVGQKIKRFSDRICKGQAFSIVDKHLVQRTQKRFRYRKEKRKYHFEANPNWPK